MGALEHAITCIHWSGCHHSRMQVLQVLLSRGTTSSDSDVFSRIAEEFAPDQWHRSRDQVRNMRSELDNSARTEEAAARRTGGPLPHARPAQVGERLGDPQRLPQALPQAPPGQEPRRRRRGARALRRRRPRVQDPHRPRQARPLDEQRGPRLQPAAVGYGVAH